MTVFFSLSLRAVDSRLNEKVRWQSRKRANNWMPEKMLDALTEEMCTMKRQSVSDSAHHMGVLYETINTKMIVDLFWTRSCTSENLPLVFRMYEYGCFFVVVVVVLSWSCAFNGLCFSSSVFGWQSLSSFTFLRSQWKDPFRLWVMSFCVHDTHESRSHDQCRVLTRKNPKSNVLWNVLRDLCPIRPVTPHVFCSFTRQLFGNRIWTFFCTLTRLLLIFVEWFLLSLSWLFSLYSPARNYSIDLIKWRLMIFPAINFTWNGFFPFAKYRHTKAHFAYIKHLIHAIEFG